MKILQSYLFRALCALVVGILLLFKPTGAVKGITIAIGLLFLVSGVISCVVYYLARQKSQSHKILDEHGKVSNEPSPVFPIVGVGSTILGFILALMPGLFDSFLMYVLGAIVILGAINQYAILIQSRHYGSLPLYYWAAPTLLLLAGIFIIAYPMESLSTPLIILGICLIIYGISEIMNSFAVHSMRKGKLNEGNLPQKLDGEYVNYEEVDD